MPLNNSHATLSMEASRQKLLHNVLFYATDAPVKFGVCDVCHALSLTNSKGFWYDDNPLDFSLPLLLLQLSLVSILSGIFYLILKPLGQPPIISQILIVAVLLPLLFCRMPFRDALSLGLLMNSKGIVELTILIDWQARNVLNEEYFAIMILSLVLVTRIVSPVVKVLYDPSRRFLAYKRRSFFHHNNNEPLRILACIHKPDNVLAILNLLAASNPSTRSPIDLVVLHLVELAGRASSLLVAHVPREMVQIHFVILISGQGKVRLTKWYSPFSQKERAKV